MTEDNIEVKEQLEGETAKVEDVPTTFASSNIGGETTLSPQQDGGEGCPTCGTGVGSNSAVTPSFVYAVGRAEWRFPRLAVEKEFAQATKRALDANRIKSGLQQNEKNQAVLSLAENRYLVRQLCWVFVIEKVDTYILEPRSAMDFDSLVEAVRPVPSDEDVDVIIGLRGPIAPPEMCNGLTVPIVVLDQIYSFPRQALFDAMDKAAGKGKKRLGNSEKGLLWNRIVKLADNAGATDEHRALNYLAVSYDEIYRETADRSLNDFDLTEVEVIPSRQSGVRKLVNVVFSFTHRQRGVTEKHRVRVDVTEEFPFLEKGLEAYYDIQR